MTWQDHLKLGVVANKESNSSYTLQDSLNLLKDLTIKSLTPKHTKIKSKHKEVQLYFKKFISVLITFIINFLGTLVFFQNGYDQFASYALMTFGKA